MEEEVYIEIPLGLEDQKTEEKICHLKKALYGLKQSPRVWFDRFGRGMIACGYQ